VSDGEIFIRCDCHSPDHLLVIDQWHWDTFKPRHSELNLSYRLDGYLPWWRRLWAAARYVATGTVHRHWWSEMIVKDADASRLRDFLNDYLERSLN
jgi:hypothetical protein